jgi:hypothetical protein
MAAKKKDPDGAGQLREMGNATTPPSTAVPFITAGKRTSDIDVRISYKIIELFSQGLYRSPHKAIEELVSNSFDAGATKVHVISSPDLGETDSTITVIDNGVGMDEAGLRQHWLIGTSDKRDEAKTFPRKRKQIGRFGIGKLATYVLSNCLTHITKCKGKYYATTMDYRAIPEGTDGNIYTEKPVTLPLRELTEAEAKAALEPWLDKAKPGYQELKLFGKESEKTWTVAIMSGLKEMAREIQRGRLGWVLGTGMPLRDDFHLWMDGDPVSATKLKGKRIARWVLGKKLKALPKPAPDNLQVTLDNSVAVDSPHHFGFTHPQLGRITGYAELYKDLLTGGKAAGTDRSHGFFVYVHGRLINADDEYFGIDSNTLRHGTFSRFRMVVHIDRLDRELRSSRESLREGPLLNVARNILRGMFRVTRAKHDQFETAQLPGMQSTQRFAASPASLARRPLVSLVKSALEGKYTPRYTAFPQNLTGGREKQAFVADLQKLADDPQGNLVETVVLEDTGSADDGLAVFDAGTKTLKINTLHPYVAHFLDEYEHRATNVPLELLCMSEVLLEAHMFEAGIDGKLVLDTLETRDELLRVLSRTTGQRNARIVAQALMDAVTDQNGLETELAAGFHSMGFDNVIKIGGNGKPDGLAEARLAAGKKGAARSYKVTLEAKSKEELGKKVSARAVAISAVVRQRKDYLADFVVVVGPDFPTSQEERSALGKEIQAARENEPGTGITLIRVEDMARLIRLVPAKRVGLDKLRDLFETCSLPEESKKWIDALADEKMARPPYQELLEVIAAEQKEMPNEAIQYASVTTRLRVEKKLVLQTSEVISLCRALAVMVPGYLFARPATVELTQRPDKVLEAVRATIRLYPEDEQKTIASPAKPTKA